MGIMGRMDDYVITPEGARIMRFITSLNTRKIFASARWYRIKSGRYACGLCAGLTMELPTSVCSKLNPQMDQPHVAGVLFEYVRTRKLNGRVTESFARLNLLSFDRAGSPASKGNMTPPLVSE